MSVLWVFVSAFPDSKLAPHIPPLHSHLEHHHGLSHRGNHLTFSSRFLYLWGSFGP